MMNIFKNIDKENKNICRVYNIGNGNPVNLMDFIKIIEKELNKKSIKIMLPMQPGDVGKTSADINRISNEYKYSPKVDINIGVKNFVDWFLKYYKNN